MSLYHLHDLQFAFGKQRVLHIPELTIEAGKITALTGPNGSGKTTLLMLLGALLWPSSGRIVYRGQPMPRQAGEQAEAIRRDMGFMLQSPYLFRASVAHNVAYGLSVRGLPRRQQRGRVRDALRAVGLDGFEVRAHQALSGGEAQRVALARALVTGPPTLLLDEPLTNVDAASRAIIEQALIDENRYRNVSILISTHDLEQAYRIADDVITLNAGMLADGPMENVLHGVAHQDGGEWVFDTGKLSILLPTCDGVCRTVTIPPEAIALSTTNVMTSARNRFRGRVVAIRERKAHTDRYKSVGGLSATQATALSVEPCVVHCASVEVTVDVGETLIVRMTDAAYRDMDLRLGGEVYLTFDAESVRRC